MKKLLTILIMIFVVLLCVGKIYAAPFLVCDSAVENVGASYQIVEDGNVIYEGTMEADGSFLIDLSAISVGTHIITARAFVLWGGYIYSDFSDPFEFTRPSGVVAPSVIQLVP